MKILVCASEYPPHGSGIGNVGFRMVREFERRGHRCTVCSPTGPDIRLGSHRLIRRFGGIGLLYFWWQVARYFGGKDAKWDAVWLHWPLFLRKCPFPSALATFHGTYSGFSSTAGEGQASFFLRGYYAFMAAVERRSLRRLSGGQYRFSAVSQAAAAELGVGGVPAEQVTYVPVGVDADRFSPTDDGTEVRRKLGIPAEAIVLLFVGRLTHPKNLFRMVDAFSGLRARIQESVLLIAGSGELQKQVARYIERQALPDVRMLGHVPNEELPALHACADFFVMASTYEGQPVALLEAMSSGVPPILSEIPVMKQIVAESGVGITVDFTSPSDAAARIADYVGNSKSGQDREASRDYVVRTMSADVCAERYLDLLMEGSRMPVPGGAA